MGVVALDPDEELQSLVHTTKKGFLVAKSKLPRWACVTIAAGSCYLASEFLNLLAAPTGSSVLRPTAEATVSV